MIDFLFLAPTSSADSFVKVLFMSSVLRVLLLFRAAYLLYMLTSVSDFLFRKLNFISGHFSFLRLTLISVLTIVSSLNNYSIEDCHIFHYVAAARVDQADFICYS